MPAGFNPAKASVVFIVEGPTDVAAMCAAGLVAVGRPSNTGGGHDLSTLLRVCHDACRIVVVGENDEKDDWNWPGLHGAAVVADQLAVSLQRRPGCQKHPVTWSLCPDGAKDVRAWLTGNVQPHTSADTWKLAGSTLAVRLRLAEVPAESVERSVRRLLADHERLKRDMAEVKAQMRILLGKGA